MKTYSGTMYDAKEARIRRAYKDKTPSCPAYFNGTGWQLDRDLDYCRRMALELGTGRIRYFEGSTEEWLDGKPMTYEAV